MDDHSELENRILHRLQARALIIGIPAIIGLMFALAQIVKGKDGKDGESPSVEQIVNNVLQSDVLQEYINKSSSSVKASELQGLIAEEVKRSVSQVSIPTGVIAGFDAPSCPKGWSKYTQANARFLLGSGKSDGLNTRYLNQSGGVEQYALTVRELPKHSHISAVAQPDSSLGTSKQSQHATGGKHYNNFPTPSLTSTEGQGKPFNIMPPFIVVTFCKKI
ncbi:TPA: hypothetical protein ACVO12_004786 [Vibrio diabolicus]